MGVDGVGGGQARVCRPFDSRKERGSIQILTHKVGYDVNITKGGKFYATPSPHPAPLYHPSSPLILFVYSLPQLNWLQDAVLEWLYLR